MTAMGRRVQQDSVAGANALLPYRQWYQTLRVEADEERKPQRFQELEEELAKGKQDREMRAWKHLFDFGWRA
jgi:hypothetical protein